MARSYGQIFAGIWRDPDFCSLPADSQWAYIMLATQGDISSCGLLSLTLGRWARYADGMSRDSLSEALSHLAEKRFVVLDFDTEEVLVRSFAKWDGGAHNSKRRPAITAAANAVVSPRLRAALAVELDKLAVPHGITDSPSDALSDSASDSPTDTPRFLVTEGEYVPDPETGIQKPETGIRDRGAAAPRTTRGTRIPKDWVPDADLIDNMRAEGIPDALARRELPKFVDYWTAKSGKDATKVDWPATWRNWLRRAYEQSPGAPPATQGRASAKAQAWLDVDQQFTTQLPAIEGRTA